MHRPEPRCTSDIADANHDRMRSVATRREFAMRAFIPHRHGSLREHQANCGNVYLNLLPREVIGPWDNLASSGGREMMVLAWVLGAILSCLFSGAAARIFVISVVGEHDVPKGEKRKSLAQIGAGPSNHRASWTVRARQALDQAKLSYLRCS